MLLLGHWVSSALVAMVSQGEDSVPHWLLNRVSSQVKVNNTLLEDHVSVELSSCPWVMAVVFVVPKSHMDWRQQDIVMQESGLPQRVKGHQDSSDGQAKPSQGVQEGWVFPSKT